MTYQLVSAATIIALFVVGTGRHVSDETKAVVLGVELSLLVMWSAEYALRIYSCVETMDDSHDTSCTATCSFRSRKLLHPLMLLDLVSMVPFGADVLVGLAGLDNLKFLDSFWGLIALRPLVMVSRLRSFFILLRLERAFGFLLPVTTVFYNKRRELLAALGIAGFLLLTVSAVMYYIESRYNDQFSSMLAAVWWGSQVLTTVGYGDITPHTPAGRIVASLAAFIGVALFGLPAAIFGTGFQETLKERAHNNTLLAQGNAMRLRSITARMSQLDEAVSKISDTVSDTKKATPGRRSLKGREPEKRRSSFREAAPIRSSQTVHSDTHVNALKAEMSRFQEKQAGIEADIAALRQGQDEILSLLKR
eukprot:gnl/TRDRNA2_/TRDRNA2_169723_c1_seq1.p1 gnl/TRDRNA2_/TRDRNA2_169723_c1~~gnl/TRDRNA2_/TRDRNA2_169723_c1_seq1.p1  ORF type:complete len:364 (-),score=49.84 gnl/TRDRNA2_/TRDRNA2_169723_c1_seq1:79-1170(-)